MTKADKEIVFLNVVAPAAKMPSHELWNGETHKIADVPGGIFTQEIFDKIWDAFIKKGSALTIDETRPFYGEKA